MHRNGALGLPQVALTWSLVRSLRWDRYDIAATKLRRREDDLVLLIQSYETLRDEHNALKAQVYAAQPTEEREP